MEASDLTPTPEPAVSLLPGTEAEEVTVKHPRTGEEQEVHVPANHAGFRIKVEFPDGATTYIDGWDPAERALSGERPIVPCSKCSAPQVLTQTEFDCSACGAHNRIKLVTASDSAEAGEAQSTQG